MKFINKYFFDFIKNFVLGGTIIGIYSLVIKYLSPVIAGHASGALPIVFTYVVTKTYLLYGFEEAKKISFIGFRGGFFWLSYSFIVFLMLNHNQNIVFSFCTALIIFIILNTLFYKWLLYKKK
jgi:hypothetical protein